MKDFDATTFGQLNAEDYDELHDPGTTDEAVDLIASLAGSGKVLEFAIGTGRVALPLARRGLTIQGIDASIEMTDKLRQKPGGEAIPVTIGDMSKVTVGETFDFVFLIFNTLFNLVNQEDQVNCFKNAATHLADGGAFLVETFIPNLTNFKDGQSLKTVHIDVGSTMLEAALHDPVAQTVHYQKIRITPDGFRLTPLPMRYAWPSEMDLMAKLAGFELESRWGGWDRSSFTEKSTMHISLYRKRSK